MFSRVVLTASVLCLAAGVAPGQIVNGSFEDLGAGQPDIFAGWTEFNNAAGNIQQSSAAPTDGTYNMLIFGPDNQDGVGNLLQGDTVLNSTNVPIALGEEWTATLDVTTPSSDPSTGALFVIALQYFNASDNIVSDVSSVRFDYEMTQDVYEPLTISAVAPASAVSARVVLVHVQLAESGRGGSMYVDNVRLEKTADAQLLNGSFETRGFDPLDGWTEFDNDSACCDNVSANDAAAETGLFGLKIFAPFNGPFFTDNYAYQDVSTFPGRTVQIDVNARNPSFDAIAGANEGFLEIQFLAPDGVTTIGTPTRVATLDVNSTFDVWTPFTVSAVTPSGAFNARCKIGYVGDDAFSGGAIHYDNALITVNGADNTINGGFERAPGTFTFESWNEYGFSGENINQAQGFVNDGANACKLFSQFNQMSNDTGVYQDLPASEGQEWKASVFAGTPFDDPIDGDNTGYMALEFVDAGNNVLASNTVLTLDFFTFLDEYLEYSVQAVAPAGTSFARINLGYTGDEFDSGGSGYYDTASLVNLTPGGPQFCVADKNTTNTNPGDPGYGEPDGTVDGADLSYYVENWLNQVLAVADVNTTNTNPGDAGYGSPDGTVDGADLSYYVEQWLAGSAGAGCP